MSGRAGLALSIALTHVRSRARQTLVGVLGVATGVGFSVMMAALMEGSQRDFITQLVDALPHILVSDERRNPSPQPAEEAYDAAVIQGLTTKAIRPGIKNPYAIMAAISGWVDGAVAPSVQAKAVVRFAGRDRTASVIGIDPKREGEVSKLPTQIREGTLADLYRASNAIILGDGLAGKIGARVGNVVSVTGGSGQVLLCTVVAFSHTGVASADDSQAYVLVKTAQILAGQTGLVNEIRVKAQDVMAAREIAARIEAETGYKSVSWQEAHEDLLSAFEIRNLIMYMVVGAILLVASFGTYNIISTITHEKTRDIAILKSLGLTEALVRAIFVLEGLVIGLTGTALGFALGYALSLAMGQVAIKSPFMDATHLPIHYSPLHYALAGAVALSASLVAAYLPARKAASLQPVDIIRGAS
ncbi:ABC transporter permease [Xanthobacter pseudotagetidis]|uniref:ABC transporter permease n=1 Tax=Xanthobacter pseudotagetidis TaxID=3119911 RepID=UPI00372C9909